MSSTQALVRSSSSNNNNSSTLVRSPSSNNNSNNSLIPALSPSKVPSPSAIATSILPKLNPLSPSTNTSTPAKFLTPQQHQASPRPSPSTPGRWQHPRMDEVIQRQQKSNFDKSNVRAIGFNLALLISSFVVPSTLNNFVPIPPSLSTPTQPYMTTLLILLRLLFSLNIAIALSPLFRTKDACEDIPLTPQQRQLLGLPAMSRPATPQEKEQYVTPPRYSRSRSTSAEPSSTPTGSRTPTGSGNRFGQQRASSGSPLTPMGTNGGNGRRSSYNISNSNRSSPLNFGMSEFDAAGSGSGSYGTPTKSSRASVGLNSKWLYEKGRASPSGAVGMGTGWGTGSVFS